MTILPYKLDTTNDQLTSRAGLLAVVQLMDTLQISERIDCHFPLPLSNWGFKQSEFLQAFILMQHEGNFHLDDVRHLSDDTALRALLDLRHTPKASTLGAWLRKMGDQKDSFSALEEVNKALLKSALHKRKAITLDIDATEIISNKADVQWTYKKQQRVYADGGACCANGAGCCL